MFTFERRRFSSPRGLADDINNQPGLLMVNIRFFCQIQSEYDDLIPSSTYLHEVLANSCVSIDDMLPCADHLIF